MGKYIKTSLNITWIPLKNLCGVLVDEKKMLLYFLLSSWYLKKGHFVWPYKKGQ